MDAPHDEKNVCRVSFRIGVCRRESPVGDCEERSESKEEAAPGLLFGPERSEERFLELNSSIAPDFPKRGRVSNT